MVETTAWVRGRRRRTWAGTRMDGRLTLVQMPRAEVVEHASTLEVILRPDDGSDPVALPVIGVRVLTEPDGDGRVHAVVQVDRPVGGRPGHLLVDALVEAIELGQAASVARTSATPPNPVSVRRPQRVRPVPVIDDPGPVPGAFWPFSYPFPDRVVGDATEPIVKDSS